MNDASFQEQAEGIEQEQQAIKLAASDLIFAWSHLETTLADLMAALITQSEDWTNDWQTRTYAVAIYFTPSGIEARTNIVSNVMTARLENIYHGMTPGGRIISTPEIRSAINAEWAKITNTMRRLRVIRNKVAHGSLVTSAGVSSGKPSTKLCHPAYFQDTQGRLNGVGSNEIRNSEQAVFRVAGRVQRLTLAIVNLNSGDLSACESKLRELQ